MSDTPMLEKYNLGDKFMYIDLKAVKKQGDIATLPFQGQKKTFTVRIPDSFQKEIKSAQFPAEQTYLLLATEAISSYHNVQLAWGTLPEMKNQAFVWMFISGGKMTMQPIAA